MRADAKRNYDKIVGVARQVFREKGYDAPLDEIAKKAGVGAGTLYRHFPTRDALLDAVMQAWVDSVDVATEKALAREGSPREVLLGWFDSYVGLISSYKGNPAKLTSAMGDPASPILTKCQILTQANGRVIDELGDALKSGIEPLQMARLIGGVATVADNADLDTDAVRPMLEVVADGLLA
ncbi:TetR/AcrR family transcriptional regulator [Nocardioides sp. Iso805N]|uniref:TetR/AcrR family transcriptional regulator n=1 Tax=Nocardioides sp. Iso805N TaxID=1283287 RepID=UPI000361E255|nr:TetR/AcrR family transcriptional regulator [Nocardioides sp. Iso805N]